MSRRKYQWTQATFDRYLKEGRGQGEGKDYKPWHTDMILLAFAFPILTNMSRLAFGTLHRELP